MMENKILNTFIVSTYLTYSTVVLYQFLFCTVSPFICSTRSTNFSFNISMKISTGTTFSGRRFLSWRISSAWIKRRTIQTVFSVFEYVLFSINLNAMWEWRITFLANHMVYISSKPLNAFIIFPKIRLKPLCEV